jgi:hypothetical protein
VYFVKMEYHKIWKEHKEIICPRGHHHSERSKRKRISSADDAEGIVFMLARVIAQPVDSEGLKELKSSNGSGRLSREIRE